MKRRLHYMTIEDVSPEETSKLSDILEEEYNSKVEAAKNRMPLRKKASILKILNPPDALWGHIGVNGKNSIDKVLKALTRMSEAVPRLTWILYGENKIFGGEVLLKNGRILNQ